MGPRSEDRLVDAPGVCLTGYSLKTSGGPLNSLPLEVDSYLDAVGNLDERDATVHAELLAVADRCALESLSRLSRMVVGERLSKVTDNLRG
jgi:hypothetical protein